MERFICLPQYECRCVRLAPGRAVSRSTMNNHRDFANQGRIQQGLSMLPAGLKYSEEEARRVRIECEQRSSVKPSASARAVALEIDQSNRGGHMPSRHFNVQFPEGSEAISPHANADASIAEQPIQPQTPAEDFFSAFPEAIDAGVAIGDSAQYETVRDILDVSDEEAESSDSDSAGGLEETFDLSDFENSTPVLRFEPRERFEEWARGNQAWVDLAVRYSAKQTLMTQVLRNLNAPYESWITIFRNLLKYSGVDTVKYLSCRSHKLFPDHVITDQSPLSSMRPECDVCVSEGTTPNYVTFEYIPILPRLRAWLSDPDSATLLLEYRSDELFNPSDDEEIARTGFADYFDGSRYKSIASCNCGEANCVYDLFIGPSCDGFDVYQNSRYDCWPIAALNLNLDPTIRFLMWNVIPFGFVGGRSQPSNLESFLVPLVREVQSINSNGGSSVRLHNGLEPLVRVHVSWFTADLQALAKVSGHLGPSAKKPCLCCDVPTFWLSTSKRYYLPSAVKQVEETGNGNRVRIARLYNPSAPRLRDPDETKAVIRKLQPGSNVSDSLKNTLRKETGIKGEAVLHRLPHFVPFDSFPIDTMHLGYNIAKDLMEISKGENKHLLRIDGYLEEDIVVSEESWEMIDAELENFGSGTSLCAFGPPPRSTTFYRNWKASEYRQFVLNYWLIALDGYLPQRILAGLSLFTQIVDLWSRPSLTDADVERSGELCVKFYEHYEAQYYKYDRRRMGMCKLIFHMLLHIRDTITRCGPPVNYSQFWVWRFIEYTKSRLNARAKAGEAMLQNAMLLESYKIFYNEHFITSNARNGSSMRSFYETDEEGFVFRKVLAQNPLKRHRLSAAENRRVRLKELLQSYIASTEQLTTEEAISAVSDDNFITYGGVNIACGEEWQIVKPLKYGRKTSGRPRGHCYVSKEFLSNVEMENGGEHCNIYYGRVIMIIEYVFNLAGHEVARKLALVDWATRLRVSETSQMYCDGPATRAFSSPTVSDVTAILNLIGVVEHQYPTRNNNSARRGKKTFFIDPQRDVKNLSGPLQALRMECIVPWQD